MKNTKSKPVDLGQLQEEFLKAQKKAAVDEKALKRAQNARDASKVAALAAETALRDATRAVLG